MKIKALVFDFFGVLHDDPQKNWLRSVDTKHHDLVAQAARRLDLGSVNYDQYITLLSEASGHAIKRIESEFAKASVDDKMKQLLENLSATMHTYLLSNAHVNEVMPLLEKNSLTKFFKKLYISSEIGMAKPDAEIFHHVLQDLGLAPREVLFVDDNHHNVLSASDLGIKTVHFTSHDALVDG